MVGVEAVHKRTHSDCNELGKSLIRSNTYHCIKTTFEYSYLKLAIRTLVMERMQLCRALESEKKINQTATTTNKKQRVYLRVWFYIYRRIPQFSVRKSNTNLTHHRNWQKGKAVIPFWWWILCAQTHAHTHTHSNMYSTNADIYHNTHQIISILREVLAKFFSWRCCFFFLAFCKIQLPSRNAQKTFIFIKVAWNVNCIL